MGKGIWLFGTTSRGSHDRNLDITVSVSASTWFTSCPAEPGLTAGTVNTMGKEPMQVTVERMFKTNSVYYLCTCLHEFMRTVCMQAPIAVRRGVATGGTGCSGVPA